MKGISLLKKIFIAFLFTILFADCPPFCIPFILLPVIVWFFTTSTYCKKKQYYNFAGLTHRFDTTYIPGKLIKINSNMLKRTLLVGMFVLSLLPVQAQEKADSLYEFHFISQKDMFFVPYQENQTELERLLTFVKQHQAAILQGKIPLLVDGSCGSAGSPKENKAIARLRANRVKSELIIRSHLTEDCFVTHLTIKDGEQVTVRVHVPAKQPEKSQAVDEIQEIKSKEPEKSPVETAGESFVGMKVGAESEKGTETIQAQPIPPSIPQSNKKYTIVLRANLLRWATLTPDLGLEWRINHHIGILANGSWTSWSWNNKSRRYALWAISPEVRYYIGKKNWGYLGAMYHVGEFNYKLGYTGRQGNYQGGGITGGYILPLNRTLSLDFHAGIGYTRTEYDKYKVTDGIRVHEYSESKNYWGINQLGITLLWKFN